MILALDLGTTTGFALHDGRDVVRSGVWRFTASSPSSAYAELRHDLRLLLFWLPPLDPARGEAHLLAYEAVPAQAHAGGDAAHRWGGFEAIVLAECEAERVRYLGIRPAAWKRAAGLRSATGEAEALAAAQRRWPGVVFGSEDEAVARFVAVAAHGRMAG